MSPDSDSVPCSYCPVGRATGSEKMLAAGALPRKLALEMEQLATAPTLTGVVLLEPLLAMMPATCVPWPA